MCSRHTGHEHCVLYVLDVLAMSTVCVRCFEGRETYMHMVPRFTFGACF